MLQAPIQLESRCCLGAVLLLLSLPTPSKCAPWRNLEKSPSGLCTCALGHPRIKAGRGDSGRAFINRYRAVKSVLQHDRSCFHVKCKEQRRSLRWMCRSSGPKACCQLHLDAHWWLIGRSSPSYSLAASTECSRRRKKADWSKQPDLLAAGAPLLPLVPPGQDCPSLPALPGAGAARSSLLLPFLPSLRAVEACGVFGKQALPVIISGPSWEVITPA